MTKTGHNGPATDTQAPEGLLVENKRLWERIKELEEQLQGLFVCMDDQNKLVEVQQKEIESLRRQVAQSNKPLLSAACDEVPAQGKTAQPLIAALPPAALRPPVDPPRNGRSFLTPRLVHPGLVKDQTVANSLKRMKPRPENVQFLIVFTPSGRRVQFEVQHGETAAGLKRRVLEAKTFAQTDEDVRLLFHGVPLKPDSVLDEVGVGAGSEIRMLPPILKSNLRCHIDVPDARRGLLMNVGTMPWRPKPYIE